MMEQLQFWVGVIAIPLLVYAVKILKEIKDQIQQLNINIVKHEGTLLHHEKRLDDHETRLRDLEK